MGSAAMHLQFVGLDLRIAVDATTTYAALARKQIVNQPRETIGCF